MSVNSKITNFVKKVLFFGNYCGCTMKRNRQDKKVEALFMHWFQLVTVSRELKIELEVFWHKPCLHIKIKKEVFEEAVRFF